MSLSSTGTQLAHGRKRARHYIQNSDSQTTLGIACLLAAACYLSAFIHFDHRHAAELEIQQHSSPGLSLPVKKDCSVTAWAGGNPLVCSFVMERDSKGCASLLFVCLKGAIWTEVWSQYGGRKEMWMYSLGRRCSCARRKDERDNFDLFLFWNQSEIRWNHDTTKIGIFESRWKGEALIRIRKN